MYHYVYVTTNKINSKYYVGVHSTHYDPSTSWDGYLGSGTIFNQAIEKYGKENFDHRIIAQFATRDLAFEAEIVYIAKCIDDPNCYNIAPGGDRGLDWNKGLEAWRKRDPDAYYAHWESIGNKVSKSIKEKWKDPEYRKQVSESIKESYNSLDRREQMSNIIKKKWTDLEYRTSQVASIRNGFTDEVRCKMSEIKKEQFKVPEYGEKLSKIRRSKPLTEKELKHYLKACQKGIARLNFVNLTAKQTEDLENKRSRERHLLKQIAEYQTNDQ